MLPKQNRLNKREIVSLKKKNDGILQGTFFGLLYKDSSEQNDKNKFGLIIPNSICKKASERNKIKRMVYLAVSKNPFLKSANFLFLAKKNVLLCNKELIDIEIKQFGNRLR